MPGLALPFAAPLDGQTCILGREGPPDACCFVGEPASRAWVCQAHLQLHLWMC